MPKTPDRKPGVSDEEATIYEDTATNATVEGEQRYNATRFSLFDSQGEYNPRHVSVTSADTTAGTLDSKIVTSGDLTKQVLNPGVNETFELGVNVGTLFSATAMQTSVLLSTTLLSPQDAFDGSSLTIPIAGTWLVLFEASCQVTNNNGTMKIAVGINGINEQSGSVRFHTGQSQSSVSVNYIASGLAVNDTVHGVYGKDSGSGSAEIGSRSVTIIRIGN